jgi:DNA-binding transcriptional ArsR family regulator
MSRMKDLFGDNPYPAPAARSRHTDPDTSHAAARSIEADVPRMELLVLNDLVQRGDHGGTWNEVSESTGLDRATVSPRFKPLREKGLVEMRERNGEVIKRPGYSGRGQIVWFARK